MKLKPVKKFDLNTGIKLYITDIAQSYLPFCPNLMCLSDIFALLFVNQHRLVLEGPITIPNRVLGKSTINMNGAFETLISNLNLSLMLSPYEQSIQHATLTFALRLVWGINTICHQSKCVGKGSLLLLITICLSFGIALIAVWHPEIRLKPLEQFHLSRQISFD